MRPPTASPRLRRCPGRSRGSLPAAASPGRRTRPRAPSTRSTRRARSWRRTARGTARARSASPTGRSGSPTPTPAPCRRSTRHPAPSARTASVTRVGDAVAVGRYVLLYIGEGLTVEDRISALEGKVAKLVIPIFTLDPTDPAVASEPVALEIERATTAGLLAHAVGSRPAARARRGDADGLDGREDLHVPSEAGPSVLASVERPHHG